VSLLGLGLLGLGLLGLGLLHSAIADWQIDQMEGSYIEDGDDRKALLLAFIA
jgi:hypothetical protein